MIHCCQEHVELALDVIVDEHEKFPLLEEIDEGGQVPTCEYCEEQAKYKVSS